MQQRVRVYKGNNGHPHYMIEPGYLGFSHVSNEFRMIVRKENMTDIIHEIISKAGFSKEYRDFSFKFENQNGTYRFGRLEKEGYKPTFVGLDGKLIVLTPGDVIIDPVSLVPIHQVPALVRKGRTLYQNCTERQIIGIC
jgi:hypothetical protein